MNRTEIEASVISALAGYLGQPRTEIELHALLRADLGLDSMQLVELLFDLEEAVGLEVPDEALAEFQSVADVVTYLERLAAGANGEP